MTGASQPVDSFPESGRLAGIDFGTVRIGVAISDPGQTLASPLLQYRPRNPQLDAVFFRSLVREERIVGFVVGLPLHLSGDESAKSNEAREFARRLGEATGVPIRMYDERFTTAFADELLGDSGLTRKKRKARRDQLAAQILLASFLDSSRRETRNEGLSD